jgi:hypothetical protein
MIIGDVVYPDSVHPRKRVSCATCDISYSNKSYKVLLDNYKLLFFDCYSSEFEHISAVICHDCFFNNLQKVSEEEQEEGMLFYILTSQSELQLKFIRDDEADDELRGQSDEVIMEDFIKDILET